MAIVIPINLPFFYTLGARLQRLSEITRNEQATKRQLFLTLSDAQAYMWQLYNDFPLSTSRDRAVDLYGRITTWLEEFQKNPEEEDYNPLLDEPLRVIARLIGSFDVSLNDDMQTLSAFFATQKGIYSTTDLIARADYIFPDSALARLSNEVVVEIRAAGRCLAFETPTASGFHMLRGVESVMHQFYISVCKPKPRPKAKLDNWGAYIQAFRKSTSPEAAKVAEMLQQVKDQDRNLIMHPEVVLTMDEAFTLFEMGKALIMTMAPRLPKAKVK